MASRLAGLNQDSQSQPLPPIDQDPVLMRVQMSLSNQGDEISRIVMGGAGNNSGSGDVMSALLAHLMTERPQAPAPVETHSSSGGGSTAGALIGAGLGALAAGASVAGSFSGKAPAVKTASKSATPPPPPPADKPAAQPAVKADKPVETPDPASQGKPQPEAKPEQTPAPAVAQNDQQNDKPATTPKKDKQGTPTHKKVKAPAKPTSPAAPNAADYEFAEGMMNYFFPFTAMMGGSNNL